MMAINEREKVDLGDQKELEKDCGGLLSQGCCDVKACNWDGVGVGVGRARD